MRKLVVAILILVLIWGGYVAAEYIRCYRPDNTDKKVLIKLKGEETDIYIKDVSLGFSITKYKLSINDSPDGTVVKEFRIFGIKVSETTLEREKK